MAKSVKYQVVVHMHDGTHQTFETITKSSFDTWKSLLEEYTTSKAGYDFYFTRGGSDEKIWMVSGSIKSYEVLEVVTL